MTDGPEQYLRPELLARRDRARAHVDEFIGMTVVQARERAADLDVPLKIIRPGAVISLEAAFGRVQVTVDAHDRVVQATVTG